MSSLRRALAASLAEQETPSSNETGGGRRRERASSNASSYREPVSRREREEEVTFGSDGDGSDSEPVRKPVKEEGGRRFSGGVLPPSPRAISAMHAPEIGGRVRVRFDSHKWYGGRLEEVDEKRGIINIKYDDGTEEEAQYPDADIVVYPWTPPSLTAFPDSAVPDHSHRRHHSGDASDRPPKTHKRQRSIDVDEEEPVVDHKKLKRERNDSFHRRGHSPDSGAEKEKGSKGNRQSSSGTNSRKGSDDLTSHKRSKEGEGRSSSSSHTIKEKDKEVVRPPPVITRDLHTHKSAHARGGEDSSKIAAPPVAEEKPRSHSSPGGRQKSRAKLTDGDGNRVNGEVPADKDESARDEGVLSWKSAAKAKASSKGSGKHGSARAVEAIDDEEEEEFDGSSHNTSTSVRKISEKSTSLHENEPRHTSNSKASSNHTAVESLPQPATVKRKKSKDKGLLEGSHAAANGEVERGREREKGSRKDKEKEHKEKEHKNREHKDKEHKEKEHKDSDREKERTLSVEEAEEKAARKRKRAKLRTLSSAEEPKDAAHTHKRKDSSVGLERSRSLSGATEDRPPSKFSSMAAAVEASTALMSQAKTSAHEKKHKEHKVVEKVPESAADSSKATVPRSSSPVRAVSATVPSSPPPLRASSEPKSTEIEPKSCNTEPAAEAKPVVAAAVESAMEVEEEVLPISDDIVEAKPTSPVKSEAVVDSEMAVVVVSPAKEEVHACMPPASSPCTAAPAPAKESSSEEPEEKVLKLNLGESPAEKEKPSSSKQSPSPPKSPTNVQVEVPQSAEAEHSEEQHEQASPPRGSSPPRPTAKRGRGRPPNNAHIQQQEALAAAAQQSNEEDEDHDHNDHIEHDLVDLIGGHSRSRKSVERFEPSMLTDRAVLQRVSKAAAAAAPPPRSRGNKESGTLQRRGSVASTGSCDGVESLHAFGGHTPRGRSDPSSPYPHREREPKPAKEDGRRTSSAAGSGGATTPRDRDGEPKQDGRSRKRKLPSTSSRDDEKDKDADSPAEAPWAQCDKCDKWRRLPLHIDADTLPEKWTCADNEWDPARNTCTAPEETYRSSGGRKGASSAEATETKAKKPRGRGRANSSVKTEPQPADHVPENSVTDDVTAEKSELAPPPVIHKRGKSFSDGVSSKQHAEDNVDSMDVDTQLGVEGSVEVSAAASPTASNECVHMKDEVLAAEGSKVDVNEESAKDAMVVDSETEEAGAAPTAVCEGDARRAKGRRGSASASSSNLSENWVQCEHKQCQKWRRVPSSVDATKLPEKWYCDMSTWAANPSCDEPEDTDDDAGGGGATGRRGSHKSSSSSLLGADASSPAGNSAVPREKGRGRRQQRDSGPDSGEGGGKEEIKWVRCDRRACKKWRKLPPGVDPASLPAKWFCDMNTNRERASCDVEEDQDTTASEPQPAREPKVKSAVNSYNIMSGHASKENGRLSFREMIYAGDGNRRPVFLNPSAGDSTIFALEVAAQVVEEQQDEGEEEEEEPRRQPKIEGYLTSSVYRVPNSRRKSPETGQLLIAAKAMLELDRPEPAKQVHERPQAAAPSSTLSSKQSWRSGWKKVPSSHSMFSSLSASNGGGSSSSSTMRTARAGGDLIDAVDRIPMIEPVPVQAMSAHVPTSERHLPLKFQKPWRTQHSNSPQPRTSFPQPGPCFPSPSSSSFTSSHVASSTHSVAANGESLSSGTIAMFAALANGDSRAGVHDGGEAIHTTPGVSNGETRVNTSVISYDVNTDVTAGASGGASTHANGAGMGVCAGVGSDANSGTGVGLSNGEGSPQVERPLRRASAEDEEAVALLASFHHSNSVQNPHTSSSQPAAAPETNKN